MANIVLANAQWTDTGFGTGTSLNVTLSSVVAGSVIHVFVGGDTAISVSSVADNINSGNYGAALDNVNDGTDGDRLLQFRKENSVSGSATVTVTLGSATSFGICAVEIQNAKTSSALDGHTGQTIGASGTDGLKTGNMTNANQPALIVALAFLTGNFNVTPPSAGTSFSNPSAGAATGWTFGFTNANARVEGRRITTTSSTQNGTFTSNSGTDNHIVMGAIYDENTSTITNEAMFFGSGTTS